MVIWLTGLSSTGKTTLAQNFIKLASEYNVKFLNIDGDIIRNLFSEKLNFTVEQRTKQIQRIQKICQFINDQGFDIIVSALYSNEDLMLWNRENFKKYYQICLIAPMQILIQRDKKNIYSKAIKGEEKNVVGIDIDWKIPSNSDLIIDTTKEDINSNTLKIFNLVKNDIIHE